MTETAPAPPTPAIVTARRGPALIILGIVGFISIGGALLALLGQGPKSVPSTIASPPGLDLPAAHAAADLRQITVDEEPPSDIVAALVVPAGATMTAHTIPDLQTLYDGSITLSVPATPSTTLAFYQYELAHDGWRVTETVAAVGGGRDVYADHDSEDGYTWEVSVDVSARTGAITPALNGGDTPAETSSVAIRLIERDDES